MKYMGSKSRIARYILPIMLRRRGSEQWWVEPFVGGGNIIDKVGGLRLGGDVNPYAIEALVAIRDRLNELPKNSADFGEDDYKALRHIDYEFKGYAGFAFSYGAKWLGGWRRGGNRDYVAESWRNAAKQSPALQGVELVHANYRELEIPPASLIYCDPPYAGTTAYASGKFDSVEFWAWARRKTASGHTVFVSEYEAPKDFEAVWEGKIVSSLTKNTGGKVGAEKLFCLRQ